MVRGCLKRCLRLPFQASCVSVCVLNWIRVTIDNWGAKVLGTFEPTPCKLSIRRQTSESPRRRKQQHNQQIRDEQLLLTVAIMMSSVLYLTTAT